MHKIQKLKYKYHNKSNSQTINTIKRKNFDFMNMDGRVSGLEHGMVASGNDFYNRKRNNGL